MVNEKGALMHFTSPVCTIVFTTALMLCFPITAVAQMGLWNGNNSTWDCATHPLSSGSLGATYTPFVRLHIETRTSRTPASAVAQTTGKEETPATKQPAAQTIETEVANVREVAFRVRSTQEYPQPSLAVATKSFQPVYLFGDSVGEQRIRKKLDEPSGAMEFRETPLLDVLAEIQRAQGIPVQIDKKAFEDAGLDLQIPITQSIPDLSLRSAIHLLMDNLDLTYLIRNDVLMITTKDRASEFLNVVLYPVPRGHGPSPVVDVIRNTIAPKTWDLVGGQATIQRVGSFLCVSQTEEIHHEVRGFLERLCEADFRQVDGAAAAMVTRIHPVSNHKLLSELETKLADICNTALGANGDATAKVSVVGDSLVVQSPSRAFHVYAAEVVASFTGVEATSVERIEAGLTPPTITGMGGGMF